MEEARKSSWIQKIGIGDDKTKLKDKTETIVTKPLDMTTEIQDKNDRPKDGLMQQIAKYKDVVNKSLMQAQDQIQHCENTRESMIQYEQRAKDNLNEAFRFIDNLSEAYDQRLSNLTNEYQQDISSIMDCYKNEKENFQNIQRQHDVEMEDTITRMKQMQALYNDEIQSRKDNTDTLKEAVDHIKKLEGIIRSEQSLRKSAEARTREALREIDQKDMDFNREIKERETINDHNKEAMNKTRDLLMHLFDNSFDKTTLHQQQHEQATSIEHTDTSNEQNQYSNY